MKTNEHMSNLSEILFIWSPHWIRMWHTVFLCKEPIRVHIDQGQKLPIPLDHWLRYYTNSPRYRYEEGAATGLVFSGLDVTFWSPIYRHAFGCHHFGHIFVSNMFLLLFFVRFHPLLFPLIFSVLTEVWRSSLSYRCFLRCRNIKNTCNSFFANHNLIT